jgi:hypothetical protein
MTWDTSRRLKARTSAAWRVGHGSTRGRARLGKTRYNTSPPIRRSFLDVENLTCDAGGSSRWFPRIIDEPGSTLFRPGQSSPDDRGPGSVCSRARSSSRMRPLSSREFRVLTIITGSLRAHKDRRSQPRPLLRLIIRRGAVARSCVSPLTRSGRSSARHRTEPSPPSWPPVWAVLTRSVLPVPGA